MSGRTPRTEAVRLADVAAAAEVSPALASRVLNGDVTVRATPETKQRILDAAHQLGYVANAAARHLRINTTGLIGLVVHDLTSPIYVDLLAGAREAAAEHGYFLLLGDADELMSNPQTFKNLVAARRIDGIIIQAGHAHFEERIEEIAAVLPTVVVNAPMNGRAGVVGVYPDEILAARTLTAHLVGLGHRRIGFVTGPHDSETSRLRLEGFGRGLSDAGIDLDDDLVHYCDWTAAGGESGLRSLMTASAGTRPTAVIAANTLIGAGALSAAAAMALAVPGQLAIAAIHDSWLADYLVPSLTTIELPLREVGSQAVRILLEDAIVEGDVVVTSPAPLLHRRNST
jgi:LacI family transcriptional regulator